MSTCISRHGEFGSHELDDAFTCKRCAVLDEYALCAEYGRLKHELASIEAAAKAALEASHSHQPATALAAVEKVIRQRDALGRRCAIHFEENEKLHARLAEANVQLANALNIPRPQDAAGGGWKSVNVDFDLDDDEPSLAEVLNAVGEDLAWNAALNSQSLEKVGATWELPSQAVVSEAVAHAVTVGTQLAEIEMRVAADKAVLEAAEALADIERDRSAVTEDSSIWLESQKKRAVDLIWAVDSRRLLMAQSSVPSGHSTADGPEQTDEQQRPLYAVMRVLGTMGVDVRGAWYSRNQAEVELDRAHRHDRSTARMPYEIYEMTKAGQATCRGSACSEGHTYEAGCALQPPLSARLPHAHCGGIVQHQEHTHGDPQHYCDGRDLAPQEDPEHLLPIITDRGFKWMPAINGTHHTRVVAYESSNASGPHIWVKASDEGIGDSQSAHLPLDAAVQFAEQIQYLAANHYQLQASSVSAQAEAGR